MRYNTNLNNLKCLEWELNMSQAILFSLLYDVPNWATEVIIDKKTYYYISRSKIISELPMFFQKEDTVYRILKNLVNKELIEYIKKGNMDLIRITEKGKTWNVFDEEDLENGKISEEFEKISEITRKNFRNNSKKNPTNNNTIYNNTNNNITNNNYISSKDEPTASTKTIEEEKNKKQNNVKNEIETIKNKWEEFAHKFNLPGKNLKLNETRKRTIKKLLKEFTVTEVLDCLEKVKSSSFLLGNNNSQWQITFDFFVNLNNFIKIFEENYKDVKGDKNGNENKPNSGKTSKPKYTIEEYEGWL